MDEYDYTTYAKQGRQLPCFCYKSVTSTNLTAKEMLRAGKVADEFAVISREQTGGRGRYDRKFLSLAGKGMYVTYVARVPSDVDVSPLGGLCALCVTDLLYEVFEIQSLIKWPNDVLSGGRKICGILPECVYSADGGKYVLLGIGVNLFYTEQDFGDLRDIATSVALQCKTIFYVPNLKTQRTQHIPSWRKIIRALRGVVPRFRSARRRSRKAIQNKIVHYRQTSDVHR